ncbi:lytic murein transglycosylase [Methylobacterium sp. J-076]|uniref:lytic murein transglycosylase n=1 Tax=Methylobacterium sp. J-076 TaxID=2836655 RepID=UPI001FB9149E|nr:lytic murein transglycosylase [Methylobacterium sp. J-076]MCJ2014442.1 lytic murein transglycosylase [Methylobacterium sp. J-076]
MTIDRRRAHPLLVLALLAAILPSSSGRADPCLDAAVGQAVEAGVPQALAAGQLGGLTPDPAVLSAAQNQAEFTQPVWAYVDASVTPEKIAEGQRKLQRWAGDLDAIEARYGVDRYTLVAFWGVESSYGAVLDDPGIVKPAIRSLATLACGDAGRAEYWRSELVAALKILAAGDATPERLTGSWAGALGNTQFMPSVFLSRAVDFDGDGRRDIWASVPDSLASTAHYLVLEGWRRGERWGGEASLPPKFDLALADETTARSMAEWRGLGVRPVREDGFGDAQTAVLYLPAGASGPAFLLMPNFAVILRYNTSFSYALTVAHLSDRLRGLPGFARAWPRGDRMLDTDERRALQSLLADRGHPVGTIDGKIGPRTRAALRAFQASAGVPADGYADAAMLEALRAPAK